MPSLSVNGVNEQRRSRRRSLLTIVIVRDTASITQVYWVIVDRKPIPKALEVKKIGGKIS